MKVLALHLALFAIVACSGRSDKTVVVPESSTAPSPSPIGSWSGTYKTDTDFWPLSGSVSRVGNAEGMVKGQINNPSTPFAQHPFVGEINGNVIRGRSEFERNKGVDIFAQLVQESDEDRERSGFLYAGHFVADWKTAKLSGSIVFRVIPPRD